MTVTLEVKTVQSRGALQIAQAAVCVLMGSVCAKSLLLAKTAWSGGVSMTAQTKGCVSMGRASAGLGMWETTAHWSTVPTTAARRASVRRDSVSARTALLEMTATLVGYYCLSFTSDSSADSCQVQKVVCLMFVVQFPEAEILGTQTVQSEFLSRFLLRVPTLNRVLPLPGGVSCIVGTFSFHELLALLLKFT